MRVLLLALALLNPIERLDLATAAAVQRARRPALEAPMRAATSWARPAAVLAIGALVGDAVAGGGWAGVRAAAVALAGTNLAVEGLKRLTGRARPDGEHRGSNASFPSSHAANAFAIAWLLAKRWRRAAAAFLALAAVVAFSRIYLNRHYLSDVVAGALIGLLAAWLATRAWGRRPAPAGAPEARAAP